MTSAEIMQIEKVLMKLIDYLAENNQFISNSRDVYVDRVADQQ